VIAAIYFDQPDLSPLFQGIASIYGMTGVAFSAGGSPPVLPGGNNLSPPFDEDLLATAAQPPPHNGVGPGEAVGLVLTLEPSMDWDAVIGALGSRSLRVGLRVQSFPDESSASFVNVVPEPAAILLVGTALLVLGRRLRARA